MGIEPRTAIVGCGLIGSKRARILPPATLKICCDVDADRAAALSSAYGVASSTDWRSVVNSKEIDAVVVATTPDMLAPITAEAAAAGKHVLVEKPGARRAADLMQVRSAAAHTGALIRVGFNHRFHRALQKARELFESGALGEPMYIRARYGHGGRPGYNKEWRSEPAVSGGGEAIDQGMHLIDLARWFLGDFPVVQGAIATYFWDMPVEDNAFFLLQNASGCIASLHATWTEWKNTFSFEFSGRRGKFHVKGLGGSYGIERLAYYRMLPEMGPPETTIFEYPMEDDSWAREWAAFTRDVQLGRPPEPGIRDAQAALEVVEKVYRGRYD